MSTTAQVNDPVREKRNRNIRMAAVLYVFSAVVFVYLWFDLIGLLWNEPITVGGLMMSPIVVLGPLLVGGAGVIVVREYLEQRRYYQR